MLRKWKCKKCEEEFWYNDNSIEEVYCKCGEKMQELSADCALR